MSDEQESMDLFGDMHPYNKRFKVFSKLTEKGQARKYDKACANFLSLYQPLSDIGHNKVGKPQAEPAHGQ